LKFLPIFSGAWQNILMNFVIKLPPSLIKEKVYDLILIVIKKYSRKIQFIYYNKNIDVPELAEIMKN
jgi:hypothetical protein